VKKLSDILYKVHTIALSGNTDVDIADVQIDSRKVEKGSLFIAVRGVAADGHRFISRKQSNRVRLPWCARSLPSENR
jgi:UDP-N-acetylmuramoyl-L-alanyl-D-glutamate--2,6-diaminopimelate ligase